MPKTTVHEGASNAADVQPEPEPAESADVEQETPAESPTSRGPSRKRR